MTNTTGAPGPATAVLAAPRSFCAGVERAIEVVERVLDRAGGPVYVRKQIVHNTYVVADLAARGAVFVEELAGVSVVGVTAGASAPPVLVEQVLDVLRAQGSVQVTEHEYTTETTRFELPRQVRTR